MKPLRLLPAVILWISLGRGQTPYNSFLYGILMDQFDASTVSIGHAGLSPSYRAHISLANPATWTVLKFAVLSGHYGGGDLVLDGSGFRSSYGHLSYAGFILPVRARWAFGLGIRPFSRKDFLLEADAISTVEFAGDTLTFSKSIRGSGGISSLFTGAGWKVNDRLDLGIQWDFLTGVLNEDITGILADRSATYRTHFEVEGSLVSVFVRTFLLREPLSTTAYAMVRFPVGNGRLKQTDHYPFLPSVLRHTLVRPGRQLSLPVQLAAALETRVSDRLWASAEIHGSRFGEDFEDFSGRVSSLEGDLADGFRISIGLLRSGVRTSESAFDQLHYRIGFYERQHYISRRGDLLHERGFGFGIGIPFGPTDNQIDLAFRFSSREGFLTDDREFLRQLTIGLTLGDVWLVKGKRR